MQTEKVPQEWVKYAYPCHSELGIFMDNLKERVAYIRELVGQFSDRKIRYDIRLFWLPGFFSQKNFLSTVL